MTVSTEISSNEYTGNGVTTDFDYKFRIFKENDLRVIISDASGDNVVTLRLGTDYTVTGANKSTGGKVILTKPLAAELKIIIFRHLSIKQETSFRNQGKFLAETHEDSFDKNVMIAQQQQRELDRAVKVPLSAGYTPDQLISEIKKDALRSEAARDESVSAMNKSNEIASKLGDVDTAVIVTREYSENAKKSAIISADAAERAEAAAQTAGENTKTFETVALGIAATQNGDYFRVWQEEISGQSFVYYKNNEGHAETLTSMPTAQAANDAVNQAIDANNAPERAGLHASEDDDYLYILADKEGRVLQRLDANLVMRFYHSLSIGSADIGSAGNISGFMAGDSAIVGTDPAGGAYTGGMHITDDGDDVYTLTDSIGRVLLTINEKGKLKAQLHDDVISQINRSQTLQPRFMSDFVHIQMYGQSLSVGLGGNLTTVNNDVSKCYMPNNGIEDGQTSDQGIEGLPLTSSTLSVMKTETNINKYENPIYSVSAQLQQMLDDDNHTVSIVGSSAGHGGYAINQLDKEGNSQQYKVAVAQHNAYKNYASSMGKSFLTHVLCWIQGETDISNGTTPQEYLRRLNQLLSDYQTDISQGAMQPVLVTYQTASHTKRTPNSTTDIAQAQLVAANTNPSIFLACPAYMFTYNFDGVHMPANSYRHMGSYFAKAIHSIMTKNEWKPLQPETIYRTGRVITIVMHVPVPPLVFDTTLVTNPGDYGFEVFNSIGVKQSIESISIAGNRVNIVLAQDPAQSVTVKYAQGVKGDKSGPLTGARGNLRDSDDTIAKLIDSNTNQPYTLFNWCPIFTLEEGFTWGQ